MNPEDLALRVRREMPDHNGLASLLEPLRRR